jgi:hypothetical protein
MIDALPKIPLCASRVLASEKRLRVDNLFGFRHPDKSDSLTNHRLLLMLIRPVPNPSAFCVVSCSKRMVLCHDF